MRGQLRHSFKLNLTIKPITTMKCLSVCLATIMFLAFTGLVSTASAQHASLPHKDFARHSIFVEIGGSSGLYSLNYDHKLADHVSLRVGGMYFGLKDNDTREHVSIITAPVMINYLLGSGSSRLELGVGMLLAQARGEVKDPQLEFDIRGWGGISTVGYRLQPRGGGFLFRIGVTPYFNGSQIIPWAGISLGATF